MIKNYSTYIKEGVEDEFNVGDIVICKGEQNSIYFNGEIGKVIEIYQSGLYLIKFDVRFNRNLHCGNNHEDPTGCSYYIRNKHLTLANDYNLEEMKRRKEELRLLHQHHDPYGEEDW